MCLVDYTVSVNVKEREKSSVVPIVVEIERIRRKDKYIIIYTYIIL